MNDYFPYGMLISDRSFSSNIHRFGYNGQEKSLEIDGNGNHNTAEYWEMESRSGRRWNLDLVVYPEQSGYSLFNNSPIALNDPLGLEGTFPNNGSENCIVPGGKPTVSLGNGGNGSLNFISSPTGEGINKLPSIGNSQFIDASRSALFNDDLLKLNNSIISQTPFNVFTQIQNDINTLKNSKFWTSNVLGFLLDIPYSLANSASLIFNGSNLNGNVPSEAKTFQDAGVNIMSTLFFGVTAGSGSAIRVVETDVVEVSNIKYIGRMEELKSIPRSQTLLDELPDLGSPKANYYQNMSILRKAIRDGYTIKDASWFRPDSELSATRLNPNRTIRQSFLGAERNLLRNKGLLP